MNARRVTAASGVIHAAQKTKHTAAGIALALEAAGLLQSPESAAELVALRARVTELEGATICPSQITTSLGTSKCVLAVRHRGDHRNAEKNHYWSDEFAARQTKESAEAAALAAVDRSIAAQFPLLAALRAEDPHDSPLHQTYAVPRDLPEVTA